MAIQTSPGVATYEFDLTTVVPAVSTTIGAFVGDFTWGPANTVTTIDSEVTLVGRFGKPDSNTFLSFLSAANFLAYGNNLKLVRTVGPLARNSTSDASGLSIENGAVWQNSYSTGVATVGEWAGRYPGSLGNSLTVSICPSANAFLQTLTTQAANVVAGSPLVTFNSSISGVVANGDYIKVGTNLYAKTTDQTANGLLVTVNSGSLITQSGTLNSVTRKWGYADAFASAPGTSLYATSQNSSNDEMHVVVVDSTGAFTNQGANTILEVFPFVSKAQDAKNNDGTTNYIRDVIFQRSRYIYWMKNLAAGTNWGNSAAGVTFTDTALNKYSALGGGVTATSSDSALQFGWDKFANKDEIDVSLAFTGAADITIANYVIALAESRQDMMVFVSPRQQDVVQQSGNEGTNITTFRNSLPSSSYTVMDCNWKYMLDKYNNVYRWVPLNADIAGLCVKTDNQRDPWWSPAGFNRGQVKNAIRLAWNPTQAARDDMYKIGINPVLSFPGQGPVLYGDKTLLSKPSAFDRINVRRLFIVLEKAISTAAKYSLFEFNDEFTRAQFVNLVEPFLRDVKGRRGLTDFRVVCDNTNNTDDVVRTNRFVGDIYIKPNYSINFITLNFVAVGAGVTFTEKAGSF